MLPATMTFIVRVFVCLFEEFKATIKIKKNHRSNYQADVLASSNHTKQLSRLTK